MDQSLNRFFQITCTHVKHDCNLFAVARFGECTTTGLLVQHERKKKIRDKSQIQKTQHNNSTQQFNTTVQHDNSTRRFNTTVQHDNSTQRFNTTIQHNDSTQRFNTTIQTKLTARSGVQRIDAFSLMTVHAYFTTCFFLAANFSAFAARKKAAFFLFSNACFFCVSAACWCAV